MLMNTGDGYKMRRWLTDEAMSSLYEHFLLEYFRRHYPCFNARSARISWDEAVTPDIDCVIGGSGISVKTLDLSQDFTIIRSQLEKIAGTIRTFNNPYAEALVYLHHF